MCKIAFTHSWLLYRQAILLEIRPIFQTLNTHMRKSVTIPRLFLHAHGKGIERIDSIIIVSLKHERSAKLIAIFRVFFLTASLVTARQTTPLPLIPFNWSFPSPLTIFRCPVCIRVFRNWFTVAKAGKACFNPFVDLIQHGSKVLLTTRLVFEDR